MKSFRIACVQIRSRLGEIEYNLAQIKRWAEKAAGAGAAVAVFPEACITGYCRPHEMKELAQPFAGSLRESLTRIASEFEIILVTGMPESDQGVEYNSMFAIGPEGDLLARYRKTHLWAAESRWATPGTEFVTFRTELAHFGLMLCYDTRFPEVARALALQGAEVLLVSSAWRASHCHEWRFCARARAIDNGVYVAGSDALLSADHFECAGSSIIAGPDAGILAQAELQKEGMISAQIDPATLKKRREDLPLLTIRRPQLYKKLLET